MSLTNAINNAKSSLRTIQADMQVLSGNVSNSGVEGYTRKSIVTQAETSGQDGGGGIKIAGYTRSTSETIATLLKQSLSDDGLRNAQKTYLSSVQDLLGSSQSDPALSKALAAFSNAWNAYATSPEDNTNKQDILYTAQNVTREVNRLATGLDRITNDVKNDISGSVTTLNAALNRINELNTQIASAESVGQASGDQRDERDLQIQKIASLVSINVVQRSNGRVAIYTPYGASLLDNTPKQFTWTGTTITESGNDVSSTLTGGRIEGLLGILDQGTSPTTLNDPGKATLYKIGEQLNKLVDLFTNSAGTFATAYDSATTGAGELASGFFTGTTRYNFALNSALATGTSTIKQASAIVVSADLNLETRSISAGNLSSVNVSYEGFINAVVATQNQNSTQVSELASIYATQKDTYSKRFKDEVGVNVDEEMVRLTQLQNNYSASARVLSTVNELFDLINSIV